MLKRFLVLSTIAMFAAPFAFASDRDDDVARTEKAAQVFRQIMDTPDKGIPDDEVASKSEETKSEALTVDWGAFKNL